MIFIPLTSNKPVSLNITTDPKAPVSSEDSPAMMKYLSQQQGFQTSSQIDLKRVMIMLKKLTDKSLSGAKRKSLGKSRK